jgi:hypothetical protein
MVQWNNGSNPFTIWGRVISFMLQSLYSPVLFQQQRQSVGQQA